MADVVIYTRPFCGYCASAISGAAHQEGRRFLHRDRGGIRSEAALRKCRPALATQHLPADLRRRRSTIGGCDDMMALERAGKLDGLAAGLMRVGLIQLRTPATQAAALAEAEPLVREAAGKGATLIVTPDGTNILQRDRTQLFAAMQPMRGADPAVLGLTQPWPEGARRLAADRLGPGAPPGRKVRQPLDPDPARRRRRGHLRQAAHVRRRFAHRRAAPRVLDL